MMRLLLIGAATLFTLSCSGDARPVLHLYTSLDAQEAPTYIEAFETATGIDVEWVRLSAGEALARLEAEKGRPQVSVWFGGPSPEYIVAAQRGLLEPYEPALDFPLAPPFRGENWEWSGMYFGVIGFACNTELLRRSAVSCPDTWGALLQPALKGQISIAYPYTSGTAYVVVAALLAHMGADTGWRFVQDLDAQIHHYNSSGSAAVTQAGLGEVGIGIAFAHDILKKGIERGYPLELRIPEDGTPSEVGAVAIVRDAPHPELAQQFVTWLLSLPAQNLLQQYYRVPLHPQASMAQGTVRREDVNVIEFSATDAALDQQAILARWRQITGR
jgi:iron(III) transport system substrate-binding protein